MTTETEPFRQHHDMGGELPGGPIDTHEHEIALWQRRIEATLRLLLGRSDPKIMTVDELRRGIESLPTEQYDTLDYYERWILAMTNILVEKGVLSRAELDARVADIEARKAAEQAGAEA